MFICALFSTFDIWNTFQTAFGIIKLFYNVTSIHSSNLILPGHLISPFVSAVRYYYGLTAAFHEEQ